MKNYKGVEELRFYCQKVLPLVYDESLSYYELLNKVVAKLNILIQNNDKIPAYILELVRGYIDNKDIDAMIEGTIRDYLLNVKYPPNGLPQAKGDGVTDDTDAIQSCIDYAHDNKGGCVYFPYGTYLVTSLTMYDNVSLKGFDRYSTTIKQSTGAITSLVNCESASNVGVYDLDLNANASNQVQTLATVLCGMDSYELSNLLFSDSYTAIQVTKNTKHVQIDNVVVKSSIDKALILNGDNTQLSNFIIEKMSVKSTIACLVGGNKNILDIKSSAEVPLLLELTGNNNVIKINSSNHENLYNDTGVDNIIIDYGKTLTIESDVNVKNAIADDLTIKGNLTYNKIESELSYFDNANLIANDEKKAILLWNEDKFSKLYKTVDDFGAVGDGITDNTDLFQELLNKYHCLVLGNGVYKLSRKLTIDGQCSIVGIAPKCSIMFWDSDYQSAGISVTMDTSKGYYSTLCTIRDCSILCDGTPVETAIKINGTKTIGDRYTLRPQLSNLQISTYKASPFDKGWLVGIDLNDMNGSSLHNIAIIGAIKGAEPNYYSTGIKIHGERTSSSNSEFMLNNLKISLCQTAIQGDFLEGIMLMNSVIIGVNYGIYWVEDRQTDHLMITGTHINARVRCVVCEYIAQINIQGNLFYIDSATPNYCIELRSHCLIGCVTGNVFQSIGKMENGGGISVDGNGITVNDNSFSIGNNTAIWFNKNSTNCIGQGNVFVTIGTKYVNSGKNNKIPNQPIGISELGNIISTRGNSVIYADNEYLHIHICVLSNSTSLSTQRLALLNLNGLTVAEQSNVVCATSDNNVCTINISSNGDIRINNKGINEGCWAFIDLSIPLN